MIYTQMMITALFFLLLSPSLSEDTVEEEIGSYQLQRLVELLTVHECEKLLMTLSNPEEHIFNRPDLVYEETNQFRLPSRTPRDTDKESHCHPALIDWLKTHDEQMYYDSLYSTLQQIGRTDIAVEMGKNINQDKILAMQRFVEEYHEQVSKMTSHFMRSQAEETSHKETHHSAKQVRSLSWKDLDLVMERQPMPPYQHHMLDGAWPLFHGLILGVCCALLLGIPLLLFILCLPLCDLSSQS
ncbi:transmembrane and death domain protein 1 [Ictalurus punctatus]|uniref:Transmembrane and death domain protein 1 n=1 Tax=Ictalurus punctatus TaxID=7998 RepID=A0A2D0SLH0_ICTPU|nr:transmembrane and death domain protein 1 [Ictalurus punctatus]XP_053542263.1 transmembrane and death domain protein 1 [Ictalurus punctatus]